jgi:hypothetical protein
MALFGRKTEPKPDPRGDEAHPALAPGQKKYGIDDAIQLMRTLPLNQNIELVLLVVRNTLQSISVDLKDVIDDAAAKQERLRRDIAGVETAIAELERTVAQRKNELAALHTDLDETTLVRERLELAASPPEVVAAAAASKHPLPMPKPPPRQHASVPAGPVHEERTTMEIDPMPDSNPQGAAP